MAGRFLSSANIKCYIVLNGEDLWIQPKNYGGFLIDFTPSVYQRQPCRNKIIPISDFRAAGRLYFEKTIINKY